ncbi:MAG: hypothetical protein JWQ00_2961 [Noviherbaspirillum sp.]|jgi:hypothetical protein|nr:hypothetical protein [Noviherbaspirillum sp.]
MKLAYRYLSSADLRVRPIHLLPIYPQSQPG